jgi:hypothetical protein
MNLTLIIDKSKQFSIKASESLAHLLLNYRDNPISNKTKMEKVGHRLGIALGIAPLILSIYAADFRQDLSVYAIAIPIYFTTASCAFYREKIAKIQDMK